MFVHLSLLARGFEKSMRLGKETKLDYNLSNSLDDTTCQPGQQRVDEINYLINVTLIARAEACLDENKSKFVCVCV